MKRVRTTILRNAPPKARTSSRCDAFRRAITHPGRAALSTFAKATADKPRGRKLVKISSMSRADEQKLVPPKKPDVWMRRHRAVFLLACCILLSACYVSGGYRVFRLGDTGYLEKAEQFSRQGKYDEAIDAYRKHIDQRLAYPKRPEWENPYFYLILIGDIQLGKGDIEAALLSYAQAEENQVDRYLVSDRYRAAAYWYQEHGRLKDAVLLLEQHRTLDPLLFDSVLDRMAKELVRQEDHAVGAK